MSIPENSSEKDSVIPDTSSVLKENDSNIQNEAEKLPESEEDASLVKESSILNDSESKDAPVTDTKDETSVDQASLDISSNSNNSTNPPTNETQESHVVTLEPSTENTADPSIAFEATSSAPASATSIATTAVPTMASATQSSGPVQNPSPSSNIKSEEPQLSFSVAAEHSLESTSVNTPSTTIANDNSTPGLPGSTAPAQKFPATVPLSEVPLPIEIERKTPLDSENSDERLLIQTHAIVIPSYASWFNLSRVHEIEKRSLPEFFNHRNRSKTNDIYTRYRNFMVNTYRLNPAEYLTVTACRRNLVGDACAIMRVHSFLDKWGLINYQVNVEHRPKEVIPPFSGHWKVLQDTPRGLFPFKFYEGVDDPAAKKLPGGMSQQDLEKAVAVEKEKAKSMAQLDASKNGSGQDGSAAKKTSSILPSSRSPSSTPSLPTVPHRIDPGPKWSKKELLALLEGIEKYANDWEKIALCVGTKTKEEAIFKFLSLSIEDPYLNDSIGLSNASVSTDGKSNSPKTETGDEDRMSRKRRKTENGSIDTGDQTNNNSEHTESNNNTTPSIAHGVIDAVSSNPELLPWVNRMGPLKYGLQNIPFAQAENPVLSVVSFLASLVDPSVVAAATGRSIEAIQKKIKEESEKTFDEDTSEEKEADKEGKTTESKKDEVNVKKETEDKDSDVTMSEGSESKKPNDVLPNPDMSFDAASSVLFGSVGARSSVLQSRTERLLYTDLFTLVSQQVYKTDAKLSKFLKLEKLLETERREIERERMEVFLDRLALARKVKKVEDLLSEAVNFVPDTATEKQDVLFGFNSVTRDGSQPFSNDGIANGAGIDSNLKFRFKEKLAQAKKILQEGCKVSVESTSNTTTVGAAAAENEGTGDDIDGKGDPSNGSMPGSGDNGDENNGNDALPISVETPQTFKLWSI